MRKVLFYMLLAQAEILLPVRSWAKEIPRLEGTEWTDVWVAHADQSDLPRVLMVGDSIARGYFQDVETGLAGKAYCARYATSTFLGNPDYHDELKILLSRYRFSVIHINNGLHGWEYTEEQYRQSLPKLMEFLKKYGNGAVIIWATTTPRRNGQDPSQLSADNGRVMERNRIAIEYMRQHGIAIDDLFSLVADHPEYYNLPKDATHFNPQGRGIEGKQVSEIILKALASKTATGGGNSANTVHVVVLAKSSVRLDPR